MTIKEYQATVKDFFTVYFDKYTASRCNTPEYAIKHIREAISSQHMSEGRLRRFAEIMKTIQEWQLAVMEK